MVGAGCVAAAHRGNRRAGGRTGYSRHVNRFLNLRRLLLTAVACVTLFAGYSVTAVRNNFALSQRWWS